MDGFHSGCRPGHIAEIALTAIVSDFWWAWDGDSTSIFGVHDFSVSFRCHLSWYPPAAAQGIILISPKLVLLTTAVGERSSPP